MVVTGKGSPHQPAIMGEDNRPFSASGQPPGICNAGIFIRPDGAMLGTGQLDPRPYLSSVSSLEDWKAAFDGMHDGSLIKAVLTP